MIRIADQPPPLAHTVRGTGPAVALLHGSADNRQLWSGLQDTLAPAYASVAIDLPGYGESVAWPIGRPVGLAAEARAVVTVMDRHADAFDLIGHSYGGAVALRLALDFPERVRSLTLIEPASFHLLLGGDGDDRKALAEIGRVAVGVAEAAGAGAAGEEVRAGEDGVARFVDYWNGPGTWAGLGPETRARLCRQAPAVARNFWSILSDRTRLADVGRLAMPALVIAGDRTTRVAFRIVRLLSRALPVADFHLVEGAGHMLPRSHPCTVAAAIRAHLDHANQGQATRHLSAA